MNESVVLFLCSLEKQGKRNEELKRADVVVLTYACNEPTTFSRLSSYWFRELEKLEVGGVVNLTGILFILRDWSMVTND